MHIGEHIPELATEVYYQGQTKKVKLNDYRGRWLALVFYPADFTFVCPTELRELAALYPQFQQAGAEVISVSTDTVFVHKAWHDHSPAIGTIQFPMAADPSGALCRAFGTYIESEGLSLRGSFIINPEGKLVAYELHDNSIGRSAQELLRKLQAAQYVAAHEGEVCPASWQPGKETLRPDLNLVGKI